MAGVGVADGAFDEECLGRGGEAAGRGGQDLQGSGLVAAVRPVVHGVPHGGVLPGQGVQGGEQARLVVFHGGEQVVGSVVVDQVAGGLLPLDVHRVGRHRRPGEIQVIEEGSHLGDLVGLVVDVALGDHRARPAQHGRQQVRGLVVPGLGAAQGLSVHGDDQLVSVDQPRLRPARRPRRRTRRPPRPRRRA